MNNDNQTPNDASDAERPLNGSDVEIITDTTQIDGFSAYEPPPATGLDLANPTTVQKRVLIEQYRFLCQYSRTATKTHSARFAGISTSQAQSWDYDNLYGFTARLKDAHRAYTDTLEAHLSYLSLSIRPGQNALPLIAKLNAELPDKYRPNQSPADDSAVALLDTMRKIIQGPPRWQRVEEPKADEDA